MASLAQRWADATLVQRLAVGATLLNVVVLTLLQFVLTSGAGAPFALFVLFVGIWLFGTVMLLVAPRFGAVGTAAWGLLAAFASYRTHRSLDAANSTIILVSLVGAVLALLFLAELFRVPASEDRR